MSLKFYVDADAIGDLTGLMEGLQDGFSDKHYLDSLAEDAHREASLEFDYAAAAAAGAGYLQHMYEYGTGGVNPGPAKFDATSPAARLFLHDLSGHAGVYDIGFKFRPAVVPNPPHTPESTGISEKYLKKLSDRKYVFAQRAMVMETGMTVHIETKEATALFVPTPSAKRGFILYNTDKKGPLVQTPGARTAGQFSAFWAAWWNTEGSRVITNSVERRIESDLIWATQTTAARAAAQRPVPAEAAAKKIRSAARTTSATISSGLKRRAIGYLGRRRK